MDHYINGEWVNSGTGTIEVTNPATGEVIDTVPFGGKKEAKLAVSAAHDAFSGWAGKTAAERSDCLMRWFQLIQKHQEDIGEVMTKEQGKPLREAIGEVQYANSFIQWYAEEGKRVYGDIIPASASNKRIFVQKQPVGVIAAITPWNFPAAMITRKVAPALAAGCTVVVKPAEQTPLTALKLAQLADKAGIPPGVFNVVTGNASDIGEAWLEDARVRKITFTGSTEVGKLLMRGAAQTVKKISLELGGHAPFIVMEDADLETAVDQVIASKFRNAGQTCVCANRIYVASDVAEAFTEAFALKVRELKVGNGLEEGVTIGPLIDKAAVDKVNGQIADAVKKGGQVAVGGHVTGHFFEPTIITGATDEMLCMKEETFGPLAPVATFDTEEEVIERANNTPYGLAAYIFTENIGRAIRLSEKLEYGIVGVNDGMPSVAQAPFGGWKESGLGREGGRYGIEEFLEVKYVSVAFK
ncbi:succinate-semialdehyde dehydrogenase / glutarate-semialdehyde dehydrogenase [Evansella caseinilytica]|uniref:Aldehyde dehydrogenase n=1 Tax=Evansella caseinilytica TaxID=1503961 RepID=A0A1H3UTH9_9BACI|nr:NAD-dependent succinate-semialdehyde dehydrogenase [Evansella caseinilytica]SDZ65704.1 succinate-semialdehyde dehydrogenase / glutarate-semialdehyde dehydrogenase [Evansella caseinilytica]